MGKISNPYSAYKISRVLKKLQDYGEDIDKQRISIVKKLCKPVLDSNNKATGEFKPEEGQEKAVSEAINDFFKKEDEFEFEYLLNLGDLVDLSFNAQEIAMLDFLIDKQNASSHFSNIDKKENA